jgi:Cu/Ag efflux pump CusA
VIGGLLCATVATLIFVPSVFALLHGQSRHADSQPAGQAKDEPIHA